MKSRKRWLLFIGGLAIVSLVAAGCGDDDDSNESASSTTEPAADPADNGGEVEGCDEDSYTDPTIIEPGREVARCEPGFPAPQPLPEMTTINVSSQTRLEFNSPLLLADSLGELEKENLKMNFINLRLSDAVPQLANGDIDVAVGGMEVALFNAAKAGLPVKAGLATHFPTHAGDYSEPQTGLWCRRDSFTTPDEPNLKEIEDLTLASTVGAGTVSFYYVTAEIRRQGVEDFSLVGANIQTIPSADTITAMENEAIDCGIILDPLWTQLADNPDYFLAASQTPGEPFGIYAFGKRLLEDNPEIGDAFTRAYIRTVNTYFTGNYHEDEEVMAEIADVTGLSLEQLTQLDAPTMDWEFRAETTTRVQEYFIDVGVITGFDEPVPESDAIDRSFYLRAVGAPEDFIQKWG